MVEPPNVRLELANRPENVMLVREMLTGVTEILDLDGNDHNDIRTAVTEACNNVVLHAYEGGEGPLEVEVHIVSGALEVVVRDRGAGINQTDNADGAAFGIGLPVIRALVHRVELRDTPGGGTEVGMEFATPGTRVFGSCLEAGLELPAFARAESATTTVVSIAPAGLARTVLPRLLSALAARAHFSTDRMADTQLVADALVAHAPGSIRGSSLSLAIGVEQRKLELRIGPLGVGHAQQLIGDSHLDGIGRVIEKLTDRHRVAAAGPYELLTLWLCDRR